MVLWKIEKVGEMRKTTFNVEKRICVIGLPAISIEDTDKLAILSVHYRPRVRRGF